MCASPPSCAMSRASSTSRSPSAATSASSSARIRAGESGSRKSVVPSATSFAPAATSSSTSRPVMTPPMPTIGRSVTRRHASTAASAIGFSAGPDRPPDQVPRRGLERTFVERRAADRVDERETVGAHRLDRSRCPGNIRVCRGKLGVERQRRRGPARRDDLGRGVRGLLDVRAREVELDRHVLELLARLGELAGGRSRRRKPTTACRDREVAAACRR